MDRFLVGCGEVPIKEDMARMVTTITTAITTTPMMDPILLALHHTLIRAILTANLIAHVRQALTVALASIGAV